MVEPAESPESPASARYPRARRVTRGAELDAVRSAGRRVRTETLEARVAPPAEGDVGPGRVGIVVPRHRHSAVDRNRLKRRLRELVRTRLLAELPAGRVVIRARAEAYGVDFAGLARQVERIRREAVRILTPREA